MTKSLHRHYKSHGKERRKRCVFRRLQKTGRDGADVTWRGRSFQVRVAATGKARSPTVDSRVRRTDSDDVDAECKRVLVSESADWRSSSARYDGAVPWRHLYARTASLYSIRCGAVSQCSRRRSGLMWSNLDDENINRAAELSTDCSRFS